MVTVVGGTFKGSSSFTGRGFRIEFERKGPGPYESMVDEGIAVRGASVEAVVKTTQTIKERIRDFVDEHFTGSEFHGNGRRRASNASAQSQFYDELESKGQYAGLVYSKFGKRDSGGFVDFLLLHMRGGTLTPRRGDWLRIPAPGHAGGLDRVAKTGAFPDAGTDVFTRPSRDGKALLLFRRYRSGSRSARAGTLELLATLVKSVVIPASLSGLPEIAAQRPVLFEGYFGEALARLRQQQGAG